MEKTDLSQDVQKVVIVGKDEVPRTLILHVRDAGILQERTEDGDSERTWFCPKCKKTFATPL